MVSNGEKQNLLLVLNFFVKKTLKFFFKYYNYVFKKFK